MCIIAFMLIFNVEISCSISYYEISILRKKYRKYHRKRGKQHDGVTYYLYSRRRHRPGDRQGDKKGFRQSCA